MKKANIYFIFFLILTAGASSKIFSQEKLKIAVIPKGNLAIFWKSIHAGVRLGATALGDVEVIWKAPAEDNLAQQISIVEQCINEGVSGIVLAPLDKDALAEPVAKASRKKIPVLIFDSAIKGTAGKDFIGIAGIDNKKAGYIAGEHLANLLGGKGKIVMLRVKAGQANISNRETGFLEAIAKYKDINIIEKNKYVSGSEEESTIESMKIADKIREANGIFCSYEQSTMGMLIALRKLNLAGKIKFVGFDSPTPAVEALKKGEVNALVTQDPARMGFQSVKAMVDHIRGKKIPTVIDVPVQLVTPENLNDPDIQKLLALPSMTD